MDTTFRYIHAQLTIMAYKSSTRPTTQQIYNHDLYTLTRSENTNSDTHHQPQLYNSTTTTLSATFGEPSLTMLASRDNYADAIIDVIGAIRSATCT